MTGEGVIPSTGRLSIGSGLAAHGARGDFFFPRNERTAVEDIVRCGGGYDVVYADRADDTSEDCEKVLYRNPRPGEV